MVLRWALAPLRLDSLRGCLYATMAQVADSRETGTAYRLQSSAVMRKAALLYNPESGGSKRRQRELQSAVEILRSGGVEADLLPTDSKEHAAEEARRAMDAGCDTIFACGGDGTVHNLVQVLANTPVALGVFPIYHAFTQDLSREHQGKVTGLASVGAWGFSFLQPIYGRYIDRTHSFDLL